MIAINIKKFNTFGVPKVFSPKKRKKGEKMKGSWVRMAKYGDMLLYSASSKSKVINVPFGVEIKNTEGSGNSHDINYVKKATPTIVIEGKLKEEGFRNGDWKIKTWKYYSETGKLIKEEEYDDKGNLLNTKNY